MKGMKSGWKTPQQSDQTHETKKPILFRVIPTMAFQSTYIYIYINICIYILTVYLPFFLAFYLPFYCGILSGIYSGILFDIYSGILSDKSSVGEVGKQEKLRSQFTGQLKPDHDSTEFASGGIYASSAFEWDT